ncbi:spindle assembly abnormal protein 6 homolog isoform X2 [Lepisosteus oculatus]|uniref:spindle assembly abnormal protein 6 homolog isoform X2 n=1 Tax=Lepisosteus oculatus TaxID=7918 RepID=UPI003720F671
MMELLFDQKLQVQVKCKDCEDRRTSIRISIELQSTSSPVHKRDLAVRLTDDADAYFLYNLVISEEDFQSLKVQQGLLVEFSAFPQKFIDLLNQCIEEQDKDNPRFLLQLVSSSPVLDNSCASLNIVETNAFKHLTHLCLKLIHGTDVEIKKYLATCLSCLKEEKQLLEQKLKRTEEDLSRQLSYTQQTLSEKSRELDRIRSEWTSQTAALTNQHSQELTTEREKTLEAQMKYQQQSEQQRRELESLHQKSIQQLQCRLAELEVSNKDLMERKYKSESAIRDLKAKLVGLEDESHRAKQEVLSLRRENSTLDSECHEKEKQVNQLQTRVAVLEQEIKDKDQLVLRTKEVLEATQQQKMIIEENAEERQHHIGKLETTLKSLSEELIKANEIIKKLQDDVKMLVGKLKLKNSVTVQQEKVLSETEQLLQKEQREVQEARQALKQRDEEVSKLQEQLEATVQKLAESKELLKTNENVITWLNKQLNENQITRKHENLGMFETPPGMTSSGGFRAGISSQNVMVQFNPVISKPIVSPVDMNCGSHSLQHGSSNKENGELLGLESKYLERRDDSIPLRGIVPKKHLNKEAQKPSVNVSQLPPTPGFSAYFPGQ